MATASKQATVTNETGIHARPATALVQKASQFNCEVFIEKGEKKVNLKSIMGVMALAVRKGETITVSAEGEGAEKAVEELVAFIEGGLHD
ncbi:HPr family phosphocarrier protein [Brevibacillus dissolubilis]|uniref:HPr family phosphocarrier protein n=1 Tax=Brevibacillus dissolubilis TaxID=1844116 RepID=UPI001117296F|nr:HPr family phosphocarrier protein [Brevibacillus dissolubilis]